MNGLAIHQVLCLRDGAGGGEGGGVGGEGVKLSFGLDDQKGDEVYSAVWQCFIL